MGNEPPENRKEVYKYYGSFARSMLTMFEITLGNWIVPARALVENVSEWYMLFFLAHKMIIGFSVVSVITAVFIQETFKVATTHDRIMIMNKERGRKINAAKMGLYSGTAAQVASLITTISTVSWRILKRGFVWRPWSLMCGVPVPFFHCWTRMDGHISFDE